MPAAYDERLRAAVIACVSSLTEDEFLGTVETVQGVWDVYVHEIPSESQARLEARWDGRPAPEAVTVALRMVGDVAEVATFRLHRMTLDEVRASLHEGQA